MITIKCDCGSTEVTFRSLSEKDFPNGWATDCCSEKAEKVATKQPKAPETKVEAPVAAVEESTAAASPEDEPAPEGQLKRRGRKFRA